MPSPTLPWMFLMATTAVRSAKIPVDRSAKFLDNPQQLPNLMEIAHVIDLMRGAGCQKIVNKAAGLSDTIDATHGVLVQLLRALPAEFESPGGDHAGALRFQLYSNLGSIMEAWNQIDHLELEPACTIANDLAHRITAAKNQVVAPTITAPGRNASYDVLVTRLYIPAAARVEAIRQTMAAGSPTEALARISDMVADWSEAHNQLDNFVLALSPHIQGLRVDLETIPASSRQFAAAQALSRYLDHEPVAQYWLSLPHSGLKVRLGDLEAHCREILHGRMPQGIPPTPLITTARLPDPHAGPTTRGEPSVWAIARSLAAISHIVELVSNLHRELHSIEGKLSYLMHRARAIAPSRHVDIEENNTIHAEFADLMRSLQHTRSAMDQHTRSALLGVTHGAMDGKELMEPVLRFAQVQDHLSKAGKLEHFNRELGDARKLIVSLHNRADDLRKLQALRLAAHDSEDDDDD